MGIVLHNTALLFVVMNQWSKALDAQEEAFRILNRVYKWNHSYTQAAAANLQHFKERVYLNRV